MKMFSYGRLFAALLTSITLNSFGTDLIVKTTRTVSGGSYDNVVVTNGGILRVTGDLYATRVSVGRGTLNVDGNLNTPSLDVIRLGVANVNGTNNIVGTLTIQSNGIMFAEGRYITDSVIVRGGAALGVFAKTDSNPFSGTLTLSARIIQVQETGIIFADKAGNNPNPLSRGGGFATAGGGGGAGAGGASYWGDFVVGNSTGSSQTDEVYMGGRGGVFGGGTISLLSSTVIVSGTVSASGGDGFNGSAYYAPGGGGGGTILIRAAILSLSGKLIAQGGNGTDKAGPGGGGWIKIYYGGGPAPLDIARHCYVNAGPTHPANRSGAQAGVIVINGIPSAPKLLAPLQNEVVVTRPFFSFKADSQTATNLALTGRIEISTNGFRDIMAVYDERDSPIGWSQDEYKTGDIATFTAATLPPGTYSWRAQFLSGNSAGTYSDQKSFTVIADHEPSTLVIANGGPYGFEGSVGFGFMSSPGVIYTVEVSRDLANWEDIGHVFIGDGNFKTVFEPADEPQLFYRVREQ